MRAVDRFKGEIPPRSLFVEAREEPKKCFPRNSTLRIRVHFTALFARFGKRHAFLLIRYRSEKSRFSI